MSRCGVDASCGFGHGGSSTLIGFRHSVRPRPYPEPHIGRLFPPATTEIMRMMAGPLPLDQRSVSHPRALIFRPQAIVYPPAGATLNLELKSGLSSGALTSGWHAHLNAKQYLGWGDRD
jgi:hypothetical protein